MTATSTTTTQSSSGTSPRCGRPLTTSYADLMKPDEDWRNLPDAAERRKIQNRLAQRAYRRNMRDRTKEVEKLKKQLQDLQGTIGQNGNTTPPPDHDSPPGSNIPSGNNTPPMNSAAPFMPGWSQPASHEHLNGLGLSGADANFDPSFFGSDVMTGMVTPPSSSSGTRPRAITASSVLQNSIHGNRHLRSNSSGPMGMGSSCPSPMPNQWGAPMPDRRESMAVCSMSNTPSPLLASQAFGGLSCSPEEVNFMQAAKPSFAIEESLGHVSYPPPPDRTGSWQSSLDPSSLAPTYSTGLNLAELPDMSKNMPETSAPLLHFAIASGSLDTLRILLQRYDIDIYARDHVGYTPLQRAVASGRTDMVQTLLDHGATVDGDHVLKDAFLPQKVDTHV